MNKTIRVQDTTKDAPQGTRGLLDGFAVADGGMDKCRASERGTRAIESTKPKAVSASKSILLVEDAKRIRERAMPVKTQTTSPHRILVVDDDRDVCIFLSKVLVRQGYQVDIAEHGQAAWNLLHDPGGYHLLITDNNMPVLSGVGLVRKLRAARITMPVIMATGTTPIGTEALHLFAILKKPVAPASLVETAKEALQLGNVSEKAVTKVWKR